MTKTTLQAWHALTADKPLEAIHVDDSLGVGVETVVSLKGKHVAAIVFAPSCDASVRVNQVAREIADGEHTEESQ